MLFDRLGQRWIAYREKLGTIRALVVDDEDFVRDLFGELLADEGFEVDVAHTAEMGWRLLGERPYDLLVTDKNLPGKSGLDLIADARRAGMDVAAVMITGFASTESISEALRLGASDYIAKPFDDVLHAVRRLKSVVDQRVAERFYASVIRDLQEAIADTADQETTRALAEELFAFKRNMSARLPVLIVDGGMGGTLAANAQIAGAGQHAKLVTSLEAARRHIERTESPLVMVLNLELPGAVAFIDEQRRVDPLVEILATSHSHDLTLCLQAIAAGATDFVDGTEGLPVLRARTKRLLDAARRQRLHVYLIGALYRRVIATDHPVGKTLMAVLPDHQRVYLDHGAATASPNEVAGEGHLDLSDIFDDEERDSMATEADEADLAPRVPVPLPVLIPHADEWAGQVADSPSPAASAPAAPRSPAMHLPRPISAATQASMDRMTRLAELGQNTAELLHELRSPLTGVKSMGQMLQVNGSLDDAAQRLVTLILKHSHRMEALVQRTARYVRGDSDGAQLEPSDINAAVSDALALLSLDRPHGLIVYKDLDPQLPSVLADPIGLEQILVNLLENARSAAKERHKSGGARILIRTAASNGWVEVYIEDNGPGITATAREEIFEPYITTKADGTGLGLYIARAIAQRSNGHLDALENEAGALFRLQLPVRASPL